MTIPRLEFEALDPHLAGALKPRVERLGYLGEFFKCMGHQPAALVAFMDFTEHSKVGLPKNIVEVIALTAAVKLENDYERNQHERLSVRLGFGRDWVERVEAIDPAGSGLQKEEAAVQTLVVAVLDNAGKKCASHLEAVVDRLGPEAAVAVLMVIGRYVTHALIVNSLALSPPVPSIFEDGFGS